MRPAPPSRPPGSVRKGEDKRRESIGAECEFQDSEEFSNVAALPPVSAQARAQRTVEPLAITRKGRSNSWREKIIRGSLEVTEDSEGRGETHSVLEEEGGNKKDDGDDDDDDDELFLGQISIWGSLLDTSYPMPTPLPLEGFEHSVRTMACGEGHCVFLTDAGQVWSIGLNNVGQLGLGAPDAGRSQPGQVLIPVDTPISLIAAAGTHSACVDELGRLFEWGQMISNLALSARPTIRENLQNMRVERLAMGAHHTIVSTSMGKILTWGSNTTGALGVELASADYCLAPCAVPIPDRAFEVAASSVGSACLTLKGVVYYWGASWKAGANNQDKPHKPTRLPFREPITKIALGAAHALALTGSHRILAVGDNSFGQLGTGATPGPLSGPGFGEPTKVAIQESSESSAPPSSRASSHPLSPGPPSRVAPAASARGRDRSVSIADDAIPSDAFWAGSPAPNKGLGPDSSGGLRAAFKKMTSKGEGLVPPKPLPVLEGGRSGRSFSLGGLAAPLVRSRAERDADAAKRKEPAAAAHPLVSIKSCSAGHKWSIAVSTEGKVFCWGEFHLVGNGQKLQFLGPKMVTDLQDVMISDVVGSDSCVLAIVGLRNEPELKFQCFNPPTISAGSLPALVNWICTDKTKLDPQFVFTIILTFHNFTTAPQLLEKVSSRYEQALVEENVHAQTQLLNFVIRWLQQRPESFYDAALLSQLEAFVATSAQESLSLVINQLLARMTVEQQQQQASASAGNAAPIPVATTPLELTSYSPQAMAEAMTVTAHAIFSKVKLTELLGQGWTKPDKELRAPGVVELTASFNAWCNFVAGHIISDPTLEGRSKRFAFWIDVHKQLYNLDNLHSATALGAAFDLTPVYRLRSRDLIDVKSSAKKWLTYFSQLQARNKAGYRKTIARILSDGDPGIPYIGSHLSDLTFIEDGNANTVDGLINFRKCNMIAKAVRPLDQLQKRRYAGLTPPLELLAFCKSLMSPSICELDELSNTVVEQSAALAQMNSSGSVGPAKGLALSSSQSLRKKSPRSGTTASTPASSTSSPEVPRRPYKTTEPGSPATSAVASAPLSRTSGSTVSSAPAPPVGAPSGSVRAGESEVIALLEKEAKCTPAEFPTRWAKWIERSQRQGDAFLSLWCESKAWRYTLLAVLAEPASESLAAAFSELCEIFLLPGVATAFCSLVVTASQIEPHQALLLRICSLGDSLKRRPFLLKDEANAIPEGPLTIPAEIEHAMRALSEGMHAGPFLSKSVASLSQSISALEGHEALRAEFSKSLQQVQESTLELEKEKVSTLQLASSVRESADKKMAEQQQAIEKLQKEEEELLARLAKVRSDRELLEEGLVATEVASAAELNNVTKRVEILETSIVDEQDLLHYYSESLKSFQEVVSQSQSVQALLQKRRKDAIATALARITRSRELLISIQKLGEENRKKMLGDFQTKILAPLVADLGIDARAPWASAMQELQARFNNNQ